MARLLAGGSRLLAAPCLPLPPPPTALASWTPAPPCMPPRAAARLHSCPARAVPFPRTRGRRRVVCTAGGDSAAGSSTAKVKSRREMLLEYVRTVQPEFMDRFVQHAPDTVVDAMRQTVTNMLGTLPPQFFEVTISTVGENLAQLMYSVMMTGYMFRNAFYRLELSEALVHALPDPSRPRRADPAYEAGVQKTRVSGHVLRWHKEAGPQAMPAVQYMDMLETELATLQQQLEHTRSLQAKTENRLLHLLKTLEPRNLQELTSTAGEDVLEAVHAFIQRLLGVSDTAELKTASSETTSTELAKLLYWLMVVGYSIRNIEVRYDMERTLGVAAPLGELPSGEF